MPPDVSELDRLAARFLRFADRDCRGSSPLYERLAQGVARDPEMLALVAEARPGQPVPNLLFAAVQLLLLGDTEHRLARVYFAAGGTPTGDDPYPLFRSFCLDRFQDVRVLVSTRLVQTNEVQRCACLLPAFGLISRGASGRPLAIIEIGASAGLNLLWDRYGYDYGDGRRYGATSSPVQLSCTVRGPIRPPLPTRAPDVGVRVGIDLDPIDVRDRDATLWLRALVWPEHRERVRRLEEALEVARAEPPLVLRGDALAELPTLLEEAPKDTLPVVIHTHTLNQWSPEARNALGALMAEVGRTREVALVSIESLGGAETRLTLVSFPGGVAREKFLASCASHAEWLAWRDVETSPVSRAG